MSQHALLLRERKENGNRVSSPPSYLMRHPLSAANGSIRLTHSFRCTPFRPPPTIYTSPPPSPSRANRSTPNQSPVSRRQRTGEYRHGVDSPPVGCYASDGMITRAQQQQQRRGGGEGQQVVGYDAYRNRWVPLSRRELEQLAAEQALARGLCGSDDAATSDAAPGFYPSKG